MTDKHKLEIHRMLVISTAHVTKQTAVDLNFRGDLVRGFVADWKEYGWVIWTGAPANERRNPDDLAAVIAFGRSQNCEYILLDRDGNTIHSLPTWEW